MTFRAEWPGVQIVLRESRESGDLIQAVETGDIDLTFIDIGPHDTGSLQIRRLLDDPMVLVAPADSPEAERPTVSIDDVAHLPMIGTRNPDAGRSSTTPSAGGGRAELRLPFRR